MNATQQMDLFSTQDMFATAIEAPISTTADPMPAAQPLAAGMTPDGRNLAGELMAIMQRHLAVSIFKLGEVHYHYTGRCHHQCELWREMDRLEEAGRVRCDFSTGERVWHLT